MTDTKKKSWLVVTNKKTYLFLAVAVCSLLFLLGDAVFVFAMKQRMVADFVWDVFICLMISMISIWFFVRFNTYSHLYNPDHPKPDYNKK